MNETANLAIHWIEQGNDTDTRPFSRRTSARGHCSIPHRPRACYSPFSARERRIDPALNKVYRTDLLPVVWRRSC